MQVSWAIRVPSHSGGNVGSAVHLVQSVGMSAEGSEEGDPINDAG